MAATSSFTVNDTVKIVGNESDKIKHHFQIGAKAIVTEVNLDGRRVRGYSAPHVLITGIDRWNGKPLDQAVSLADVERVAPASDDEVATALREARAEVDRLVAVIEALETERDIARSFNIETERDLSRANKGLQYARMTLLDEDGRARLAGFLDGLRQG